MNSGFVDVVEGVKQLSIEEKLELRSLLDSYLIEERRTEIFENYQSSKKKFVEGKLEFASNLDNLEAMLDD